MCKQIRGFSDLGVYYVIILAGIISCIDLSFFCFFFFVFFLLLISVYHFSIIFSNTTIINNTKLKTEKIDWQSYFGVMQCSVMRTFMYTY